VKSFVALPAFCDKRLRKSATASTFTVSECERDRPAILRVAGDAGRAQLLLAGSFDPRLDDIEYRPLVRLIERDDRAGLEIGELVDASSPRVAT
jgi:hypothetical protein